MQLILNENIDGLGRIGEVVKVKAGFGRNYLIPRGLAFLATQGRKKEIEHHLRLLEGKKKEALKASQNLADQIGKITVNVYKQVGENERIFGSVTTAELEELLLAEGVKVSRKDIILTEDIKKIGAYKAEVRVHPEVKATFKFWVISPN